MTMADDYKDFWQYGGNDGNGNDIWWSKDDSQSEDHMPPVMNRGSGSLCIMNSKTFRWSSIKEIWEEI